MLLSLWIPEGFIAGGMAGVVVETALYPIDTIKTRLQAGQLSMCFPPYIAPQLVKTNVFEQYYYYYYYLSFKYDLLCVCDKPYSTLLYYMKWVSVAVFAAGETWTKFTSVVG